MAARSQASGGRGRRARIARAAGAASDGAAGGAMNVANVSGQQGLEGLDGLGSGELLEQVGQVRGGVKAIGRGCRNKGKEIGARASSPSFIRLINGSTVSDPTVLTQVPTVVGLRRAFRRSSAQKAISDRATPRT